MRRTTTTTLQLFQLLLVALWNRHDVVSGLNDSSSFYTTTKGGDNDDIIIIGNGYKILHDANYYYMNTTTTTTRSTRRNNTIRKNHRTVQQTLSYYYENTNLGNINYDVTMENPMKGLVGNPNSIDPSKWPTNIPASIHHYKIALTNIMKGDPDVVGAQTAFDWTLTDSIMALASQYKSHVVLRVYLHWPGIPLSVPQYLLKSPYNIQTLWYNKEIVPWYGDVKLKRAIEQFIDHLARRYDGDTRLYAIQAGLIGFWGEWHTLSCTYKGDACDPESAKKDVVGYFIKYWKKTKIQFRYPNRKDAQIANMGFHDDSYTLETVSGPLNGGVNRMHFFWNMSQQWDTTTSWKNAPTGGETRPENQNIFDPNYPMGTEWHQDPMACAEIIHASFLDWGRGMANGGVSGRELTNARSFHARVGYNYQLTKIAAFADPNSGNTKIGIDVTIRQVGTAPFYYPLFLDFYCDNGIKRASNWVGTSTDLSEKNSEVVVRLSGIPATVTCLNSVEFRLDSYYLYPDRPIRWAQTTTNNNNGRMIVSIPIPLQGETSPRNNSPVVNNRPAPVPQPILPKPAPVPQPVPFPQPLPQPVPQPQPPVKPPTTSAVGNQVGTINACYLVCAASSRCGFSSRTMGQDLTKVLAWDYASSVIQRYVGKKVTVRCDTSGAVSRVSFQWPGQSERSEKALPWTMNGNDGNSNFYPADYLASKGQKSIIITPYNGKTKGIPRTLGLVIR